MVSTLEKVKERSMLTRAIPHMRLNLGKKYLRKSQIYAPWEEKQNIWGLKSITQTQRVQTKVWSERVGSTSFSYHMQLMTQVLSPPHDGAPWKMEIIYNHIPWPCSHNFTTEKKNVFRPTFQIHTHFILGIPLGILLHQHKFKFPEVMGPPTVTCEVSSSAGHWVASVCKKLPGVVDCFSAPWLWQKLL